MMITLGAYKLETTDGITIIANCSTWSWRNVAHKKMDGVWHYFNKEMDGWRPEYEQRTRDYLDKTVEEFLAEQPMVFY